MAEKRRICRGRSLRKDRIKRKTLGIDSERRELFKMIAKMLRILVLQFSPFTSFSIFVKTGIRSGAFLLCRSIAGRGSRRGARSTGS